MHLAHLDLREPVVAHFPLCACPFTLGRMATCEFSQCREVIVNAGSPSDILLRVGCKIRERSSTSASTRECGVRRLAQHSTEQSGVVAQRPPDLGGDRLFDLLSRPHIPERLHEQRPLSPGCSTGKRCPLVAVPHPRWNREGGGAVRWRRS